jgi:hypothetical protein
MKQCYCQETYLWRKLNNFNINQDSFLIEIMEDSILKSLKYSADYSTYNFAVLFFASVLVPKVFPSLRGASIYPSVHVFLLARIVTYACAYIWELFMESIASHTSLIRMYVHISLQCMVMYKSQFRASSYLARRFQNLVKYVHLKLEERAS